MAGKNCHSFRETGNARARNNEAHRVPRPLHRNDHIISIEILSNCYSAQRLRSRARERRRNFHLNRETESYTTRKWAPGEREKKDLLFFSRAAIIGREKLIPVGMKILGSNQGAAAAAVVVSIHFEKFRIAKENFWPINFVSPLVSTPALWTSARDFDLIRSSLSRRRRVSQLSGRRRKKGNKEMNEETFCLDLRALTYTYTRASIFPFSLFPARLRVKGRSLWSSPAGMWSSSASARIKKWLKARWYILIARRQALAVCGRASFIGQYFRCRRKEKEENVDFPLFAAHGSTLYGTRLLLSLFLDAKGFFLYVFLLFRGGGDATR